MGVESPGSPEAVNRGAVILDTSVAIALMQEGRGFDLGGYEQLVLTSVTYAELRMGVAAATSAEIAIARYSTLEDIQGLFGAGLPFDDDAAQAYGRILQTVVQRGGQPRAHVQDRMIAAIAAANRMPLLTLNGADLRGLDDHVSVVTLQ